MIKINMKDNSKNLKIPIKQGSLIRAQGNPLNVYWYITHFSRNIVPLHKERYGFVFDQQWEIYLNSLEKHKYSFLLDNKLFLDVMQGTNCKHSTFKLLKKQ
jgi:hypothetical protein